MALPAEVRAKYTTIIDDILAHADLSIISEKRIRKGLQDQVEYDITPQKAGIKALILERFDVFNAKQSAASEPVPSVETADPISQPNGHHTSERSDSVPSNKRKSISEEPSDVVDAPPKKKRKPSVDNDAVYAAKLQAEEDKRARPTRNGVTKKKDVKKKRAPKKKTAAKVTGSDDSEVEDGGSGRKVNRETGFHKPLNLSPGLSALFDGETALSRPQVTKRIWQYIKAHDLQDPSDKRYILCDGQLQGIFKQDKVHMFTMTKLLSQQMYAQDE